MQERNKYYCRLAEYAVDIQASRGRRYEEEENKELGFHTDRSRIINSIAFRRLEYKTQVFINYIGDHYRTRMTHTLEVAQTARMIARKLALNEDLTECIALAHDIGHPPFGHSGEDALKEVAKKFGGFDHNAHALKILTHLEQKHIDFNGINLTWETLEGIAKHNGPLKGRYANCSIIHGDYEDINRQFDLQLETFPSLEAQVSSLADDITYINHDIDDGLRAGFITIEDLKKLDIIGEILSFLETKYPNAHDTKKINTMLTILKDRMIEDLVLQTHDRIKLFNIRSALEVRNMHEPIAIFSPNMKEHKNQIKSFLFARIYRHYKVNRTTLKTHVIIKQLFEMLLEHPNCMPPEWFKKTLEKDIQHTAEVVIDYIAGMTDRYAVEEHQKLFNLTVF